jgi:hypothetical protein
VVVSKAVAEPSVKAREDQEARVEAQVLEARIEVEVAARVHRAEASRAQISR